MAQTDGDWHLRPVLYDDASIITNQLKKTDYTIAVDETGTPFKPRNCLDANNQWFSLTSLFFLDGNLGHGQSVLQEIHQKYWPKGFDGQPIVLHSRDIRKRVGPFNPKIIDYSQFRIDLNDMLKRLDFRVSSVSVDKIAQSNMYAHIYNPYQWCTMTTIERIVMFLENSRTRGRIIFESRGSREDQELLTYINQLFEEGTKYMTADRIKRRIAGVYFERKIANDQKRMMWPLQVSDLISYRLHHFVQTGEYTEDVDAIWDKLYGYPEHIFGRGLKIFPGGSKNDFKTK